MTSCCLLAYNRCSLRHSSKVTKFFALQHLTCTLRILKLLECFCISIWVFLHVSSRLLSAGVCSVSSVREKGIIVNSIRPCFIASKWRMRIMDRIIILLLCMYFLVHLAKGALPILLLLQSKTWANYILNSNPTRSGDSAQTTGEFVVPFVWSVWTDY